MHKNNSYYFPKLELRQLRHYAKLWRDDYSDSDVPIVRIVLYKYHSKYTKYWKMKNPDLREAGYVITFEVSGLTIDPDTRWVTLDAKNQEEERSIYQEVRDRFKISEKICDEHVFEYITNNYDEKKSFYHKVREQFNVPKNIPAQDVLKHIKDNHRVKVKIPQFLEPDDIEVLLKTNKMLGPFQNKRDFIRRMDNTPNACRGKSIFIYSGFDDVYKQQPGGDDFYKEWRFIAVPPGGLLPKFVYVDDSWFLVLWPAENQIVEDIKPSDDLTKDNAIFVNQISIDKLAVRYESGKEIIKDPEEEKGELLENNPNLDTPPKDVIDHVAAIKPLVNEIYNSLKEGPGWDMFDDLEGKKSRMEDALCFYDESQTTFSDLPRNILDDPNLYKKGPGKEKRDIVGRIVKKSIELKGLGNHSARKLYKIFKSV